MFQWLEIPALTCALRAVDPTRGPRWVRSGGCGAGSAVAGRLFSGRVWNSLGFAGYVRYGREPDAKN